ncbi:hypothetical protein HYW76_00530 [Candidatus Pacearchaeota archaeon]|nr:hypothetical protein [Candidatus Pacearchaeota archaeon]
MKTKIISIFVFLTLLSILYIGSIQASISDVNYPVAELGNCNSQEECEKYCDDVNNMELCLNFAEKNGIMSADEIAEARKFMPLMKSGDTPGGCKNQRECKVYCDNDANLNVCIEFAKKAGIISQEEYEMVKKTGGKGPGGCKGKKECEDFCDKDENFNICIEFAKQNGLISDSDYENAKKTGGKGPGGCKKDECNDFCSKEENFNICVDFAYEHGMMNKEEYEMAKKTGGKGPGNCKGKEECEAFCNNPDNQETCMNFAIEHGLMSEADLANMKKNQEFMNSAEGKCQTQCLKDAGVDSKSCGEGGAGPEACKTCADKCFSHDNEKCLNQEKWQQLNQDCQAKGSGYHLEEVRGDDGNGKECVIDETCVYSSDEMWESQEEKDRKLAEMEEQWAREREEYENENGPGGSENQEEYTGGCTEPGPEGQCNPGPGAGPEPNGEGDSSEGSDSSESSSGGGGEQQVTGAVIMKVNSNSDALIIKIIEHARNLF